MEHINDASDGQVLARINSLLETVIDRIGELTVQFKDGKLEASITVKSASSRKQQDELMKMAGLLREIQKAITRREWYEFTDVDLKEMGVQK